MPTTRILAVVALIAVIGAIAWTAFSSDETPEAAPLAAPTATEPIPVLRPAPALVEFDGWLNTDASTFEELQDRVTIVQFWTFGCFNCKNTLDNLGALYEEYGDQGLEIIGVHAPEFDYEADPDNVAAALVDLDVVWPVALDTEKLNFQTWQDGGRRFWPRTYVLDANGDIRFDHIGEGAYDELNSTVARLLAEPT